MAASSPIGVAENLPRRFVLPVEARGKVPLEFLPWCLYSTVALPGGSALPRTIEAFGYTPGQLIPGAGAGSLMLATDWHTNMLVPRQLPAPKTFTVSEIRIHCPHVLAGPGPSLPDAFNGAAPVNDDGLDDIALAIGCYTGTFRIGEKEYAVGPIAAMPANSGIGGVMATAIDNTNATNVWLRRTVLHTKGPSWSFEGGRTPVLVEGQTFAFTLESQFATNPTLTDDRWLCIELHGTMGREIQ